MNKYDGINAYPAWGKLAHDESGRLIGEHPLLDHMTDVAECFLALSRCSSVLRALTRTAGRELDAADMQRLAVLVFLHDVGKANAGFQSRRWKSPQEPPDFWTARNPSGHGPEGWELMAGRVTNAEEFARGLPIEEVVSWGDVAVAELLQASISHHGRPLGEDISRQSASIWQPVRDLDGTVRYDPAATIEGMGKRLRDAFPLAFSPCQQQLPEHPAFVHLFAGLVQLADWIGSDTRAGFFPYTRAGEDRRQTARASAAHAVQTIGLDNSRWFEELTNQRPDFGAIFNVPSPRPMQSAAAGLELGNIVVLEAETGSGKTEAALWRFVQLFQAGKVDSLYFALPTRVAATQLCARVLATVKRLWPTDPPVVVRALPGYEAADDQLKISLPDFKVHWPDRPDDERAHQRWAAEAPKRFLAATIAVGTIDQALLASLKVRHAHMRHALLSRSLLVVDEVHASDAYMTVLLEKLLQAHQAAGGQAMLLSATLGSNARTRYLNIGHATKLEQPTLQEASAIAYPLISARTSSGIQSLAVEGNPKHKLVHWKTVDVMDDPERVAALAAQAAAQGARVLIVRNSVPAAVATLKALEAIAAEMGGDWLFKVAGVSTVHHSRYSKEDRPLLDRAVEAQLGKVRNNANGLLQGRVVIGTQTVEQSLDIDADLLITDLCPMDVLLQRLGRLHRHARPGSERPDGFQEPQTLVLTPSGDDLAPMLKRASNGLGRFHNGGGVYADLRILEATRRLIAGQPTRKIPSDNRLLVECATHKEALKAIEDELGEDWERLGQQIEADTSAGRGVGHLHTLPYGDAFSDVAFPDSDQKIATRLGAADRLVVFYPAQRGPFGQDVKQLALRFHQAPADLDKDAQPEKVTALGQEAGFEFSLGSARYRYDRFGIARLKAEK